MASTKLYIKQNGVYRLVDRKIDMALVNRDLAVAKLQTIRKDGTAATQKQRNDLTLIALKASLEAGLGDVSSKDTLL